MNILQKARAFLFFSIIFITSFEKLVESSMAQKLDSSPTCSAVIYDLTPSEITSFEQLVKQNNDAKAAFRLYQYYTFSLRDEEKIEYYLNIAANKGNVTAQYNLAYIYMEKDNLENAYKWAILAQKNGAKYAGGLLSDIQNKLRQRNNSQ